MHDHENPGTTRDEALQLMKSYLKTEALQKHSLATEVIMRKLARIKGEHEDIWGIAGLLHDLDFEATKDDMPQHTLKTEAILRGKGVSEEIIQAIKGHNAEHLGYHRGTPIEHALVCSECITGLVIATALVYPDQTKTKCRHTGFPPIW